MTAPAQTRVGPARGPEDVVLRLRPIVHASLVADGLHVRGARASFTVSGGSGLWPLWRALAAALADGCPAWRLGHLSDRPAVQGAIDLLLAQLSEHDLLVAVPDGWGRRGLPGDPPDQIARWLEAAAPDPVSAWRALRAATVIVRGDGCVAAAALRTLRGTGIPATAEPLACGPEGGPAAAETGVVVAGELAVAAASGHDGAVVTPVGTAQSARASLAAIVARTGLRADQPVPFVLAALAGGAAAHRLICAVAGLPDPGHAASSFAPVPAGVTPPQPGVLVARLDPLRAQYHPWAGAAPDGGESAEDRAEPADVPRALAAAAVLSDAELGVMPPAELADLPQLPVAMARCRIVGWLAGTAPHSAGPAGMKAGQAVYGVGVNAELARLTAMTGWCAHILEVNQPAGRPVAVGATRLQADGILLRRLADRMVSTGFPGSRATVGEELWTGSAQARLWWKAVTLRFAAPARMEMTRVAEGIYHAAVSVREQRLGWAVESTPGDAAAFAALTAAGALQVRKVPGAAPGQPAPVLVPACGAQPPAGPADASPPGWQSGIWVWPADVVAREHDFRGALRDLTGGQATTVLDPAGWPGQETPRLLGALRALGFSAVTVPA